MKLSFLPTREISARPGIVMRRLHREGAMIVTDHGKPRALLLAIDEESFLDDMADLINRRASRAVQNIRARAKNLGLDKMTAKDIDAEISAVRKARG